MSLQRLPDILKIVTPILRLRLGVSHSLHLPNRIVEKLHGIISYMKLLNILKYSNNYYSTTGIAVVHYHNHRMTVML